MTTIFTLNINNYEPEIRKLTYPLMREYARKIGADFVEISGRCFPSWPVSYEKLQIYELGESEGWNLFFDADTLIHPDTIDFTDYLLEETVYNNSKDMAGLRWKFDRFFHRDGRSIGTGNWLAFVHGWCIEYFKPLEISLTEALENIHPTREELAGGLTREHFIDGYATSRNVAKYGLDFDTLEGSSGVLVNIGLANERFFWHGYNMITEQKVLQMKSVLESWKVI